MSKGNAQKAYEKMAEHSMNCAQSVLTSFCEDFGLNKDLALKIARGFGGGMGQSKGICGAVTGAYMVLGLGLKPLTDPLKNRAEMGNTMAEFNRRFKQLHGSLNCTELCGYDLSIPEKATEAHQKGVFANICPGLVRDAVKILEDILKLK
jgi:C_GCAxxG_C_C family probable redox protein